MMDKKEFYEKRAELYGTLDKQGQFRYLRALELVTIRDGDKILDIGCKHAYLSDILTERKINFQYYGVDISESVIQNLKSKKGNFQVCDVMKGLPFEEGQFDYVFCMELLEHVENPTFLLNEINRTLNKSGCLILSVPNPYNWILIYANIRRLPAKEGHIHSFTFQDLTALADFTGFEIKKRIGTYTILPYSPHGIKKGRYFMFRTNCTFLAASFIYRIEKVKNIKST